MENITTEWNDDDRDISSFKFLSISSGPEEEYIPIHKILKELYDEERDALYCHTPDVYFNYSEENIASNYNDNISSYDDILSEEDGSDTYDYESSENEEEYTIDDMVYKKFWYY